MKLLQILKLEFSSFNLFEKIFFSLIILIAVFLSIITNDKKIIIISTFCSLSYTILAGKGKFYCYLFGIIGSIIYAYLAFINKIYASFFLWILYYIPSEITGIFYWKKHLDKTKREIVKIKLNKRIFLLYFLFATILSLILSIILQKTNDITPFKDAFSCVYSILAQFLTVKRCIEQWYLWFIVNIISLLIWINIFSTTHSGAAYIFLWGIYLILSIYFLIIWEREIRKN